MKHYIIHTNATTYNPNRSYFANTNRYARTYTAHTETELETLKTTLAAREETITGIYTNTGKRIY